MGKHFSQCFGGDLLVGFGFLECRVPEIKLGNYKKNPHDPFITSRKPLLWTEGNKRGSVLLYRGLKIKII
jgi:hypothetical protein